MMRPVFARVVADIHRMRAHAAAHPVRRGGQVAVGRVADPRRGLRPGQAGIENPRDIDLRHLAFGRIGHEHPVGVRHEPAHIPQPPQIERFGLVVHPAGAHVLGGGDMFVALFGVEAQPDLAGDRHGRKRGVGQPGGAIRKRGKVGGGQQVADLTSGVARPGAERGGGAVAESGGKRRGGGAGQPETVAAGFQRRGDVPFLPAGGKHRGRAGREVVFQLDAEARRVARHAPRRARGSGNGLDRTGGAAEDPVEGHRLARGGAVIRGLDPDPAAGDAASPLAGGDDRDIAARFGAARFGCDVQKVLLHGFAPDPGTRMFGSDRRGADGARDRQPCDDEILILAHSVTPPAEARHNAVKQMTRTRPMA